MPKRTKSTQFRCPVCGNSFYLPAFLQKESPHPEAYCPHTQEHIKIECQKRFDSVPKEERQEILNLFRSGKSIKEIKEIHHYDTLIIAEVIARNIESVSILRKETV